MTTPNLADYDLHARTVLDRRLGVNLPPSRIDPPTDARAPAHRFLKFCGQRKRWAIVFLETFGLFSVAALLAAISYAYGL